MGYTQSAVRGFSWQSILKILTALLTLGKIAILARLLSPNDFGQFALVALALGISEAVTQTGINITILQSPKPVRYFLDTAWVIALVRGLLIAIIMVLLGLFLARYYQDTNLQFYISVASLVPLIKGAINPNIISFRKKLQFFKESVYYFALALVEALLAIAIVAINPSVLSLIFALIGTALFEVIISMVLFKTRPRLQYIPSRGKIILQNAKGLSLSAFLNYIQENCDDFIIGKTLGTYNLGIYHNAYALSHKPNYEFAKAIFHSTLPVFTRITNDVKRLKRAVFKTMSLTTLGVITTSLPLLFFPDFFVQLILGDQWLAVIPLVPWLIMAGILQSISSVGNGVLLAKKSYFLMNLHAALTILLMISLLIWFSTQYGLAGAAMAIAVSRFATLPVLGIGIWQTLKK